MPEPSLVSSVQCQIDYLKELGVTFELCSEEEACTYLCEKTYLAKLLSFCSLFEQHIGGPLDGRYVNLDFAHLKELATLDQQMRYVLLPMTLDIEHFSRVKLVREAMVRGESSSELVDKYLSSLSKYERSRRESDLRKSKRDATALLAEGKLGLDEFLEVSTFGTTIDVYLFCAKRWNSKAMREEHYLLRQVKAVRNCCAHSNELLQGITGKTATVSLSASLGQAVAQTGIPKRTRRAKLQNAQLRAIATVLYAYSRFVRGDSSRRRTISAVADLSERMDQVAKQIRGNDALRSSLNFLVCLFDNWFASGHNTHG